MTGCALSRRTAERLIEIATMAPSMHNSQPWRFVVRRDDRVIEIYVDPARTLSHGDPQGRAVHIACGAALFNLRLAIAHAGTEPIARVLPERRNPLLLGSVRLGGPYRPRPAERDLFAAIQHRQLSREQLTRYAVPRRVLAALVEAAMLEGVSLRILDQGSALRILNLAVAADHQLRTDPMYRAEIAGWLGRVAAAPASRLAGAPTGAPAGKLSGSPAGRLSGPHPAAAVSRLAFVRPSHGPEPGPEAHPHLALLCCRSDDRASWLRIGQTMQRVLLLAAHHGVPASPLTPVREFPDAPLRFDPAFAGEHPQMLLRLGNGPATLPAPRRPVWQILRMIPPCRIGDDESPVEVSHPALVAH
jgi:Nitroreductase family